MRSLRRAVSLVTCCLLLSGCVGPLEDRSWVEVRTPNIVIWSALRESEAVELATRLEAFRHAISIVTSIEQIEERIPTHIYLLPGPAPELGFPSDYVGLFQPGLRANNALVRPARGMSTGEVLYHEFTHFLMNNHSAQDYPAWYQEGFAELLATLRTEDKTIEFGRSNKTLIDTLRYYRWLPYSRIVTTHDPRSLDDVESGLFYAQSWALVHYLHFGRGAGARFGPDNVRYLHQIERAVPHEEAFANAFGVAIDDLAKKIEHYLNKELHFKRFTLKEGFQPPVPRVRPMQRTEIAAKLGGLSLSHDPGAARAYFQSALLENPNEARAIAGLADTYKFEERYAEAEPLFERAVALEPDEPLNRLDLAEYLLEQAYRSEDREEQVALARRALSESEAANALRPEQPESLAIIGQSLLVIGEAPEEGVAALEAAHALLPSYPPLKVLLAQAYVNTGRPAEAIPLLRVVIAWSHGGHEAARDILTALAAMGSEARATDGENEETDARD